MIRRRTPLKRSTKPIPRKRAKPRRVSVMRDPKYLLFLKHEGKCVACQIHCIRHGSAECQYCPGASLGRCDPAHGPVNGRGSKGPDDGAIPLCRGHHEYQTGIGWEKFEAFYQFSREAEAKVWYAAYLIWREQLV